MDVLCTLEGDLAPVACLADGSKPCSRAADCRPLPLWKGLNEVVSSYPSKFTVQDLIHKDPDNFDNIP
jgi:DNA-binding IscR family transcriptional regulator